MVVVAPVSGEVETVMRSCPPPWQGTSYVPGFASSTLTETRTAESLNRGKWVFQTYCLVCHGENGQGNGPVSVAGGGPFPGVPSLVDPTRPKMTDGAIYGMIVEAQRMGRGLMPRYGDKVHGTDRWDLVNYVRNLQLNARAGQ